MSFSLAAQGTPVAELKIDAALVRSLLTAQHPDLAAHSIQPVGEGWDNVMFKLGDALAVRLPRRQSAARLIRHEQLWLPKLAPRLTLPVPVPTRVGRPSNGYPWYWSVSPWLAGETADLAVVTDTQGGRFGDFLRSLHTPAPDNAPSNPFRGISLKVRSSRTQPVLDRLNASTDFITPRIQQIWQDALNAPAATQDNWLHGDLHPRNILVETGIISGIIDWGDVTSGDISTDLAAVWMLFSNTDAQQRALARYGASEAEIIRAKGWAIVFAAALLETGLVDSPRHAAIGKNTLQNVANY
ncbi:MAG: aminoglycoside phosphotransferase family protein [Cyanobacteria bacterium P01_D01_bin.105]